MEVTRIRALRGPNLWSHHTAIQSIVACSGVERSIGAIDGFESRLRSRFPKLGRFSRPDMTIRFPWSMCWNWPLWVCRLRLAVR